jgi:cobalt/nickel transport system permease protein
LREQSFIDGGGHRHRRDILEGLTRRLLAAVEHATAADELAVGKGLLQKLDPRIKIVGLLVLIVTALYVHSLLVLLGIFAGAGVLALASGVSVQRLLKGAWIGVLAFTGVLMAPSIFIVPGEIVARLPLLDWPITLQGLRSAAFVIARAEISATLGLLLILTTPWPHVLKALRTLGMPIVVVAILGMTYRYIFVLLQTAAQMFEARRSRTVGPRSTKSTRRAIVDTAGVLLGKSLQLATDVHMAMVARGYRGEVHLLHDFRTAPHDWIALTAIVMAAALAIGIQ